MKNLNSEWQHYTVHILDHCNLKWLQHVLTRDRTTVTASQAGYVFQRHARTALEAIQNELCALALSQALVAKSKKAKFEPCHQLSCASQ